MIFSRLTAGIRKCIFDRVEGARNTKSKGFRRWVDEQLRTGAGCLHSLSKPSDPEPDKHVALVSEGG